MFGKFSEIHNFFKFMALIGIGLAVNLAFSQDNKAPKPLAEVVTNETYGSYQRLIIQVSDALPDDAYPNNEKLILHFGIQENKIRQHWGEITGQRSLVDRLLVNDLQYTDGTLKGTLEMAPLVIPDKDYSKGIRLVIELDANINGDEISGNYSGFWEKITDEDMRIVDTNATVVYERHLEWITDGNKKQVSGNLFGEVIEEDTFREKYSLNKDLDWPQWLGQGANNGAPSGYKLMNNFNRAPLLWRGESTPPARNNSGRHAQAKRYIQRNGPTGGGSSPIVKDGLVYLYYWVPDGDSLLEKARSIEENNEEKIQNGEDPSPSVVDFHRFRATDFVICMDGETGQTVWKTSFKLAGYNRLAAKGSYTANMVVQRGKVIGRTSGEKTFALDAKTGEFLWESDLGGGTYRIGAGDVVVGSDGEDLVGLNINTGEEAFRKVGMGPDGNHPGRWVHQGKEYIIAGNEGSWHCVNPENGDVLWSVAGEGQVLCTGDYLLSETGKLYHLALDGATEIGDVGPIDDSKLPAMDGNFIYHRGTDTYSEELKVFSISERKMLPSLTGTDKSEYSHMFGKHGFVYAVDDIVVSELDATHTNPSGNTFATVNIDEDGNYSQAYQWATKTHGTTSYHPDLMTHAFVDGRLYIRQAFGIHCYDLREGAASIPTSVNKSRATITPLPEKSNQLFDVKGRFLFPKKEKQGLNIETRKGILNLDR